MADAAAGPVEEPKRHAALAREKFVPEAHERDHARIKIEPHPRQPVFVAHRAGRVGFLAQDALGGELGESRGERGAGNSKHGLKYLEAARAEEALAKHEEGPGIAQDADRACHGAVALGRQRWPSIAR